MCRLNPLPTEFYGMNDLECVNLGGSMETNKKKAGKNANAFAIGPRGCKGWDPQRPSPVIEWKTMGY